MDIFNPTSASPSDSSTFNAWIVGFVIVTLAIYFLMTLLQEGREDQTPLRPPLVAGSIPILGHLTQFCSNPFEFVRSAHRNHGPIFQINILLARWTIVCGVNEAYELLKDEQHEMGFGQFQTLKHVYLNGITDLGSVLLAPLVSHLGKTSPNIHRIAVSEAENCIKRLKAAPSQFDRESMFFGLSTVYQSLYSAALPPALFHDLLIFKPLVMRLLKLDLFIPHWLLQIYGRWLNIHGLLETAIANINTDELCGPFTAELHSHFHELAQGKGFGNHLIMGLVSSGDNIQACLRNVIADLLENPTWLTKVRTECEQFIRSNTIVDVKGLIGNKTLHACVMETARLNTNVIISKRIPTPSSQINSYYVGDSQIFVCPSVIQTESAAHENPSVYNPGRYLTDNEQVSPKFLLTWGNGPHKCPAKYMSLAATKAFVALLVVNFDLELQSPSTKFIGAGSFLDRTFDLKLTVI